MDSKLKSVEYLFRDFFKPLCGFAVKYVTDLDEAKNIVHEVFLSFWEKFDSLPPDSNYRSYLYTATRNRCLNHIRDRKKVVAIESVQEHAAGPEVDPVEVEELEREVDLAINTLPDKCRQIFEMSRFEGLKYAEIAAKLGISVKTVEAQMTKALGILKTHLDKFLILLILWTLG